MKSNSGRGQFVNLGYFILQSNLVNSKVNGPDKKFELSINLSYPKITQFY